MKTFRLIIKIIPKNFKNKSKYLLFLFLVASIFEVLSIGVFLPLLTELTSSNIEIIQKFKLLILDFFPNLKSFSWIYIFLILIVAVFLIKNLILSYIVYYQNKYIQDLTVNLSSKLLEIYLNQKFVFHKMNNSSKLIRNINVEIAGFIAFFTNILKSISELIFLSAVIIFLILVNPLITLTVIFLFTFLSYIINLYTKQTLDKLGSIRLKFSDTAIKNLQQSLGAIKEIKIGNLENKFTLIYKFACLKIASAISLYSTLQQIPRLIFEFFIVFIACLILLITFKEFDNSYVLTLVGIYTLTAVKTAPSVVKIYLSIQQAIFYFPAVNVLNKEINLKFKRNHIQNNFSEKNYFDKKITLKDVSFQYAGTKYSSLKKLSFDIKKGEKIGIIGESGSGKSTLVDLIMGLIDPSNGKIEIDNFNLQKIKKFWQSTIGYVPQNIYLMDDTIQKNLILYNEKNFDKKNILEVIKKSNLEKTIKNLPKGLSTVIGERGDRLSAGQRQRIGIARALYRNPKLLILDEPTSSLDKSNEKLIIDEIVKIKDITLIVVTHNEKILKRFDKIISLKDGRIKKIKIHKK